ncbi:Protein kinase domain-containing protein [Mycena sanguinolenta]|uniref:non-specific serine/threonine protein kinase n=1 Tax=Mycena sanguinolenta TaxID=230812 RepID=A0A8H7D323_9AGAR|nr:Protein kinase domain-containing protein [Mycena sanguinolenta]
MANPFVFMVLEDMEDEGDYRSGGLFPVKLGDVFGPEGSARYRISAKLGYYGSYSTVWLARDLVANRTVALKIVRASETATSRETAILKHLSTATPGSHSPAVLQLLDSFILTSANGSHQVLVTEPVILLDALLALHGIQVDLRSVVHQALEGLAFIYERGVVRLALFAPLFVFLITPNLYPRNMGAAIDLDSLTEVDIWSECGPPSIIPLVTCEPAHDTASFPPYLTAALDLRGLLARGFAPREPRRTLQKSPHRRDATAPRAFMAPEIVFPIIAHGNRVPPWDWRADIWGMGCTISQIAGGGLPYEHSGTHMLSGIATLCGGAPADWTTYFASVPDKIPPRAYTPQDADALWTKTMEYIQRWGQTAEDARRLVASLRRMLVMDPMGRPSAAELLRDPYFVGTVLEDALPSVGGLSSLEPTINAQRIHEDTSLTTSSYSSKDLDLG